MSYEQRKRIFVELILFTIMLLCSYVWITNYSLMFCSFRSGVGGVGKIISVTR